ncbi:MAG: hypothetical protein SFU56_18130 [Capsulimonadales bacterium]|nr:hypothetical protein [Capsulimonadales bacterium]
MNKIKQANRTMCSDARRELSRHSVDCNEVQISSSHGVIYLHGKVRPVRGREGTFESDITVLIKALRQRAGIRDVVTEWTCIF